MAQVRGKSSARRCPCTAAPNVGVEGYRCSACKGTGVLCGAVSPGSYEVCRKAHGHDGRHSFEHEPAKTRSQRSPRLLDNGRERTMG
jgi:hypothetical protein